VPETVVASTTFAPREQFPDPTQHQTVVSDRTAPGWQPTAAAMASLPVAPTQQPGPSAYVVPVGPSFNNTSISSWSRNVPIPVDNADTSAYWLDDDDAPAAAEFNGAPLAQYGQPSTWPCASNQACVPTGSDGLHPDGTVCLFGNARPAPIPPLVQPNEEIRYDDRGNVRVLRDGQWVVGVDAPPNPLADLPDAAAVDRAIAADPAGVDYAAVQEAAQPQVVPAAQAVPAGQYLGADHPAVLNAEPDDDTVGKVMKAHKDKAAMQKLATEVMRQLGVKESDPDGIKLAQYKADLANAIVTLAYRRGVEVPGIGVPSGPGHPKAKGRAAAKTKQAEDPAVAELAKETATAVRAAVASIQAQTSIDGLTKLHDYYANDTRVGWTPEMQVAARTRAAELDAASGTASLSPDQMIDGATSMETLSRAYQIATNGGQNLAGWTAELDAKAQAKHGELQSLAMSANG
jgi:hypothetical protein